MKKNLNRLCAVLFILFSVICSGSADFSEGKKAYDTKRYEDALKEFLPLAEKGNPEAQFYIGVLYYYGYAVSQDWQLAFEWFEKAARQKDVRGLYQASLLILNQKVRQDDQAQALMWLSEAAEGNYVPAQATLGYLYLLGNKIAKDCRRAKNLLEAAAFANDVSAQKYLFRYYSEGACQDVNYPLALMWLKKAADAGDEQAIYDLGVKYLLGVGMDPDWEQAQFWFQKSVNLGNKRAIDIMDMYGLKRNEVLQRMHQLMPGLKK